MPKTIPFIILMAILFFVQNAFAQSSADFAKMTPEKWREDLQFLAREFPKRHRNLFHTISRENFESAVAALDQKIPSLSNNEAAIEFAKIAAMIGGGHTEISLTRSVPGYSMFPIQLYFFEGKLYITAATKPNAKFIGMQVLKIGDTPIEEAFQRAKAITSRDPNNEAEFLASTPRFLIFAEILQALKVIEKKESATFTLQGKNGEAITLELSPVNFEKIPSIEWIRSPDGSTDRLPLPLQNLSDNYWLTYLPDSKTVYFKYNACRDQDGKPSLKDFTKQLFDVIKQKSAGRLIIDMRHNSGGNFHKSKPLLESIINTPAINQKGKLFVILGRQSYSASIVTAILLKNKTQAIFVGESPRGSPNFLEDVERLRLPNSKLEVDYSVHNSDLPKLETASIYFPIDISASPTLEDYLAGEDTFLKKILNF